MQGLSTYLAALLSGNINILYGGGTAVSRAIAALDLIIIDIGEPSASFPSRHKGARQYENDQNRDENAKLRRSVATGLDLYAKTRYSARKGKCSSQLVL